MIDQEGAITCIYILEDNKETHTHTGGSGQASGPVPPRFCCLAAVFASAKHDAAEVQRPRIAGGDSTAISHFHNEKQ